MEKIRITYQEMMHQSASTINEWMAKGKEAGLDIPHSLKFAELCQKDFANTALVQCLQELLETLDAIGDRLQALED